MAWSPSVQTALRQVPRVRTAALGGSAIDGIGKNHLETGWLKLRALRLKVVRRILEDCPVKAGASHRICENEANASKRLSTNLLGNKNRLQNLCG
eukprot:CAMPEP_0206624646 /NCGR_PEP_ID=MMETSP0325_2-20121206/64267_1 /ASSEMBLY_ACC=CAM_ASM_000347 /TAXON_ID=2866 /ORGANISM="Crypthecodinium cohnii, Strain Seligo" /LENGTH=94 /DNA_ID=CAMNT_0054148685 /DNA_START=209 /DNA_END=490 /DNA_ORIENTATION=+